LVENSDGVGGGEEEEEAVSETNVLTVFGLEGTRVYVVVGVDMIHDELN
jgi:hypothetical protein